MEHFILQVGETRTLRARSSETAGFEVVNLHEVIEKLLKKRFAAKSVDFKKFSSLFFASNDGVFKGDFNGKTGSDVLK